MTDTYLHAWTPQESGSAAGPISPRIGDSTEAVPDYLRKHYWWAYIHPLAVNLFERQWLVSAILWGNYGRLRDAALAELSEPRGATLQVACAYGDLTVRLMERQMAANGTLDVVDVLPIQLQNLRKKLPAKCRARLLTMNSTDLQLPDRTYDQVLVFFLLHEQPADVRRLTLDEAFRVLKPEGIIVIVDYALPQWWHPLRYTWRFVLAALEPFALDLWRTDVAAWIPPGFSGQVRSQSFFGGLYRMTTATSARSC